MEARPDPLVIGAIGGSGTRVFSRISRHAGVFMGGHLDNQEDSQPVSRFYSECASDYLAADGHLAARQRRQLSERLSELLHEHLEGLPHPDHPWGIKNPRSILMLRFWHERFPGMRFLHVVRNGLDMAYSEQQNQIRRHGEAILGAEFNRPGPERAMLWWARVNGAAADYGEATLGGHYTRVRLEDLCANPKRTVRSLFGFIGSKSPMKGAVREVTTPPSLERWRQRPRAEIALLESIGRDELKRFGYLPPG